MKHGVHKSSIPAYYRILIIYASQQVRYALSDILQLAQPMTETLVRAVYHIIRDIGVQPG